MNSSDKVIEMLSQPGRLRNVRRQAVCFDERWLLR